MKTHPVADETQDKDKMCQKRAVWGIELALF